jgi:heme A synthase
MRIFAKLVCLLFFVSVGIGLGHGFGATSAPLFADTQLKQQTAYRGAALGAVGGVLAGLWLGSLVAGKDGKDD